MAALPLIIGGGFLYYAAWGVTYPEGGFDSGAWANLAFAAIMLAVSLPVIWASARLVNAEAREPRLFPEELLAVSLAGIVLGVVTILWLRTGQGFYSDPDFATFVLSLASTALLVVATIEILTVALRGHERAGFRIRSDLLARLGVCVAALITAAESLVLLFASVHAVVEYRSGDGLHSTATLAAGAFLLVAGLAGLYFTWRVARQLRHPASD